MDLKSSLVPGDLFVSYWLAQYLTVVVGDHRNILSVETVAADSLLSLITNFEELMTNVDRFTLFIAEQHRPATLPGHKQTYLSISETLTLLGSILVTPDLHKQISSGKYQRLIVFPDGILHALPIHLLIDTVVGSVCYEIFSKGILYAPSASSYVYACAKRRSSTPRHAAILIGDKEDEILKGETKNIAPKMPCETSFIYHRDELERISPETDILYIATHGHSPEKIISGGSRDRSGWTLDFDKGSLDVQDFFGERVKLPQGAVVVLSACSVGHQTARQIHEIDGFVQALFYAGAATVLAARWPIPDEAAEAVFAGTLDRVYQDQCSFGSAFNGAVIAARKREDINRYIAGPEANTFFWGPFVIFGCGD